MPPPIPINPVRYPTLFRYVNGLPQGLDSYPDVQSSAEVAESIRQRFGAALVRDDLPDFIKDAMGMPWKRGTWIPEAHFMTLNALVRDVIYRNDEGYLQFCFDTMKAAYSSHLMRSVMFVMAPSVLALATEKRWSTFKRGVALKTLKSMPDGRLLSMTYPPRLYLTCMLDGVAKSIEAALSCTRAKQYSVITNVISDTECQFLISWIA